MLTGVKGNRLCVCVHVVGDARIGHWTGWEPRNDSAIDQNVESYNSLGWSQQSLAASLKANQLWSGPGKRNED